MVDGRRPGPFYCLATSNSSMVTEWRGAPPPTLPELKGSSFCPISFYWLTTVSCCSSAVISNLLLSREKPFSVWFRHIDYELIVSNPSIPLHLTPYYSKFLSFYNYVPPFYPCINWVVKDLSGSDAVPLFFLLHALFKPIPKKCEPSQSFSYVVSIPITPSLFMFKVFEYCLNCNIPRLAH